MSPTEFSKRVLISLIGTFVVMCACVVMLTFTRLASLFVCVLLCIALLRTLAELWSKP